MKRISLVEEVHKIHNTADMGKNSHYVFIRNRKYVNQQNDICYARLICYEIYNVKVTRLRIYINQHKRENITRSSWDRWMKWVTQESYWRHAFSVPKKWEEDGIAIKCSFPLPYAMGAACALREGYEYPVATDAWAFLVDKGVHPALAHAFSLWLVQKDEKGYQTYSKGHHAAIRTYMSREGLKKYMFSEYISNGNRKPMNKSSGPFGGIFDLFPETKECPVYSLLTEHKKSEGTGWNRIEILLLSDKLVADILTLQQELQNA